MDRVGFRINDINKDIDFCKRIHLMVDGQEYTLINRGGKLEIIGKNKIKLTMGGGCNIIYVSDDVE